jgi:hypothetical protein
MRTNGTIKIIAAIIFLSFIATGAVNKAHATYWTLKNYAETSCQIKIEASLLSGIICE